MKKEKQVKSYKRRTKSGKVVTVKAHTAKYEASDKAKEVSKKEGAGKELEAKRNKMPNSNLPMNEYLEELKKRQQAIREEVTEEDSAKKSSEKKKEKEKKVRPVGSGTNGPTPKKKSEKEPKSTKTSKPTTSEPAFTAAEFKEWYRGTGSAADKKVAKALRAQLGRAGYRKLEDEAIDNYSSRGHLSMFKRVSGGSTASTGAKSTSSKSNKESKVITNKDIEHALRWDEKRSKSFDAALKKVTSSGARTTREVKEGLAKLGYDYDTGKKVRKTSTKESAASLRERADKMDAADKKATIEKKVGKGFRTIKNAQLSSPKPNTRTGTLRGDLYIGKDGSAYYADPINKGKLKKASERILSLNGASTKKVITTTKTSKSSSKTTSDSNEGSLKIPDDVKEPRGLRKAVMDAGYHVKYQNGKWKQQMATGTWRVTTPREIIRGAKEDISTHPSWATKKEAMDKAKKGEIHGET